jgi:hypothetical protein
LDCLVHEFAGQQSQKHKNMPAFQGTSQGTVMVGMSVCLPTVPDTGDSPAITTDLVTENESIQCNPYEQAPDTSQPPCPPHPHRPIDLIPTEVRNRLREIVLKNRDPRKTLQIFQSRIP